MSLEISLFAFGIALLIFALRVVEMSLDTLRVLFIIRGRKAISWGIGFIQSLIFVVAITSVLSNLENPITVLGYAGGFATGVVVGMYIEERLAIGYTHVRMISPRRGTAIAERLRNEGYAITEVAGRGKDGAVTVLNCSVLRKNVDWVTALARDLDPEVFVTGEDIRPVQRGFWRA